jgi:hypothetical protein
MRNRKRPNFAPSRVSGAYPLEECQIHRHSVFSNSVFGHLTLPDVVLQALLILPRLSQ